MSSEQITVACSYCGEKFSAIATDVDRLAKCPHCHFMTKVPRLTAKRITNLKCPQCQTEWDIPIKMRGKVYTCWYCGHQAPIIGPAQFKIEQTVFPTHVEQETQVPFKIIVSNSGTIGQFEHIHLGFLQQNNDISSYYQVQLSEKNPIEVDYQKPIEIEGVIAVYAHAPAGWTMIAIELSGFDKLDHSKIVCNAQIEWMVCYQRAFVIETEHHFKEQSGVPFTITLFACLPNGEVDTTYQGSHHIQFSCAQNNTSHFPPQIPAELDLFFQQGIASTYNIFTLFDSSVLFQLSAIENSPGGPNGTSEAIQVIAGKFATFEIHLHSPQIDHCPFRERNTVRAVDQYGNTIEDFAQDVWIHPINNKGEIEIGNYSANVIPGSCFRGGTANLTSLNFVYNADPQDLLPTEISFIVSYENKEECSEPIFIEPNPVQISISQIVVPEAVERDQQFSATLEILNKSKYELQINPADFRLVFLHQNNVLESGYKVQAQQIQKISLNAGAQTNIPIIISLSQECPLGETDFHIMIFAFDPIQSWYGRAVGHQRWNVVPSGRVFRMLEPTPAVVQAGEPFSLVLVTYLQDKVDESYRGKHTLICEATAPESPNNIASQIPNKIEVEFSRGIAKTNPCFLLTNSSMPATIKITDLEAGGPKGDTWSFEVRPGNLEFFIVNLQPELMNSRCFDELNQVMAMDAYGNLIVGFEQNCQLISLHKKGDIKIGGQNNNVIPASAFQQGIADLNELQISYHSHIPANLPDPEEFVLTCNHKKGQSKPVKIFPRPGKLNVVRCSAPEEVEQSGEDYPIYLELENLGDRTLDISSVMFTFRHQEEDISSHYSVTSNPSNSTSLIAGVPIQIVYTVKVNSRAPVGVTDVLVKVSGIDTQSRQPMQSTATFQWKIEPKQRFFRISTEHENQEIAGVLFGLKIFSYLENQQRDVSLQGEYSLEFTSNATNLGNNKPEIPNPLTVMFVRGEATTARVFKLVNTSENPFIQVKDAESKAQGHTGTICILPDSGLQFMIQLDNEVTNTKILRGHNTIMALDTLGNIKKNFANDVAVSIVPDIAYLANVQGTKISSIRAEWFREGIADLTSKELIIYAPDEAVLPGKIQLQFTITGSKPFLSSPILILPSPIQANLDKLELPPKILPGRSFPLQIAIINRGLYPIKIEQLSLSLYQGDTIYRDYKIKNEDTNGERTLPPGNHTLHYSMIIGQGIGYGKILGKLAVTFINSAGVKLALPEFPFSLYVEATGRIFKISTSHNQQETAGIPFALNLITILEHDTDIGYEGTHTLHFTCNASPTLAGQKPEIPASLALNFAKGKCATPDKFILFRSDEIVDIKVQEATGGTNDTVGSTTITVLPSVVHKLQLEMQEKQTHLTPFTGINRLVALDAFGNFQKNFQAEIILAVKNPKAKLTLAHLSSLTIPKEYCRDGQLDLTPLGLCYEMEDTSSLPCTDVLTFSCQNQQIASQEITIQPRPASIQLENLAIITSFYQGQRGISLTLSVNNSGDSKVLLNNVMITFKNDGDITEFFSIVGHPQNRTLILPHSKIDLQYFIDANNQAKVGTTDVLVSVQATDTIYNQPLESNGATTTLIIEKMRDFKIDTEHGNQEIAGAPFFIKLVAMKDQDIDRGYHGNHEIFFALESKSTPRYPQLCSDKETVVFSHGYGQTSNSFILTDTTEHTIIKVEEPSKAKGISQPITLIPSSMRGFKIIFPKPNGYQFMPIDSYDNAIQKTYILDEDVRPGAILSGSYGNFYEVQDLIGVGAMGKVYRGVRLNDGLDVAIKTTMFSALSDINRFILEGLMIIKFTHPNIVKGYDLRQLCIQDTNRAICKLFMVMEYLPGQSAKDVLDSSKSGVMTPIMATRIILYTARALAYMWEHQTTHRDIKPENIQITVKDEVKLIDLGIAHAEMGEVDIAITQRDSIVGSYPYISPERFKSTNSDLRSDIYSLGATYYQFLSGMAPYIDCYKGPGGQDLFDYLIKCRSKKPPTHIQRLANVNDAVAKAVMTMLEISVKMRYQTAEELIGTLETIYQEMGGKL